MTKDALSCCLAKKRVQQPLLLSREVKVSATENYQQTRVHYAYHEAGHALVGHVIGRVIEEVSIGMRADGYGGYCRFNPFIEDANDHPDWRDDQGNPELITIYYAGMLATAYACAPYVTYDEEEGCVEYPQGSERDDLEHIHRLLTKIETNEQQRETCRIGHKFSRKGLAFHRDVLHTVPRTPLK